jgi:hypothetical protein
VLGTLVGPRTAVNRQRATSTSTPAPGPAAGGKVAVNASPPEHHPALARSTSETTRPKLRKTSTSSSLNVSKESSGGGTADEFFIDVILARHARKLLAAGRLADLGRFAAHLDFPLVGWLRRESARAGEVADWGAALARLHQDFRWPWPGGATGLKVAQVEEKLAQLYVDCGQARADSGYQSGSLSLLSEQTVDAMLRVRDPRPGGQSASLLSEEPELGSVCGGVASPLPPSPGPGPGAAEVPARAEVQVRYLLQLLLEAGCLDWAALAATLLRDGMAIIRIVNAARSAPEAGVVVRRLHEGFRQLEALPVSSGYRTFLGSIRPQARSLATFLGPEGGEEGGGSPPGAGSQHEGSPPGVPRPAGPVGPSPPNEPGGRSRASSARTRSPSPALVPDPVEVVGEQEEEEQAGCILS